MKHALGHIHFSLNNNVHWLLEPEGHGPYGLHILGDILPYYSVAAGRCYGEIPFLICKDDLQSVYLGLHGVFWRYDLPELGFEILLHPLVKGPYVVLVESVVKRPLRNLVLDLLKLLKRRPSHALRGRVRSYKLRILLLKLLEFSHECVI